MNQDKTTEQAAEEYIKPFANYIHIGQEENVKNDFIAGADWMQAHLSATIEEQKAEIERLKVENAELKMDVEDYIKELNTFAYCFSAPPTPQTKEQNHEK